MKVTQLPYLGSAAAMTVGLYLLASPLREDATTIGRLASVWAAFVVYEFLVIGAVWLLRTRGAEFRSLGLVSCFFLTDPVFFSNSFASTDPLAGLLLNTAATVLTLFKAALLARAWGFNVTPWLAGWVSGALGFIHLFPSLIAFPETLPVLSELFGGGLWAATALVVPLVWTDRKMGLGLAGALAVHSIATGMVMSVDFDLFFLTPPFLAAAILLPWRRFRWIPAAAAFACSPLRTVVREMSVTQDGLGIALVLAAFVLLGVGVLRSLARSRRPGPEPVPRPEPESVLERAAAP